LKDGTYPFSMRRKEAGWQQLIRKKEGQDAQEGQVPNP